jgi:hypothetical protein
MLLLTVVSANAGGGSLLTLTKQCGDSQMSYSSRALSQGDIVLGGGPPTGVYEITSSTSGTAWCYRYEVKKNDVLIYSGSFGPYCGANLSLEITAQQGDIITLGLAADIIVGGGTCTGGSGTIRFGVE